MRLSHPQIAGRGSPYTQSEARTRLQGRWLVLTRGVWLALVILTLGTFFASHPVDLEQLQTPCAGTACWYQNLTPGQAGELKGIGLSPGDYAAYTVAQALKLPYAAIALKQGDELTTAASYGLSQDKPFTLPLVYQTETIGQLLLAPRAHGDSFTAADRKLLEDIARQAGVAVHAVRLTADLQRSRERIVTAREEERRRLRRDLHDGLGATLAALHLQVGAIRTLMRQDLNAAEAESLDLQEEIRSAITDIRRLVYALRPPTLDELGLVGAIQQYAAQHDMHNASQGEPGSDLRVAVEAPEHLPALPAAVEVAAYRIVQEALTNVARHARARSCRICLSLPDDHELQVEVIDDGVGMPKEPRAGVGLLSMRERAEEVGGLCVVEQAPGRGTRVLVKLLLPKE